MTTAAKRKTLLAKLVPGKDDDLIAWLESIPDGAKNQEIKNTLRAGMGWAQVDYSRPSEAAPQAIEGVATVDDLAIMRAEFAQWTERMIADLPSYVRGLVRESMNGQAPEQPSVEAAPALPSDEIEKRVNKLKKQNW